VIDLRDGVAVHARGGDRAAYRPVRGALGAGDDPLALMTAYRDRLGLSEVYLADLDAIDRAEPARSLYTLAADAGVRLWVDAGVRELSRAAEVLAAGAERVVLATETLDGPKLLKVAAAAIDPGRLVFGLDLRSGRPLLAPGSSWRSSDPDALLDSALDAGIGRVLILDLARVGSGEGVGGLERVRRLRSRLSRVEVSIGGGVRSIDDVDAAFHAGADAVLVGSALHDGRISTRELLRPAGRP
jgi:phosphoribosylformimino-5-aminoimidazole carboxamide ribotide isomerase